VALKNKIQFCGLLSRSFIGQSMLGSNIRTKLIMDGSRVYFNHSTIRYN